jgi:hypothetical protein
MRLAHAFKLPSASKLLLILAVLAALIGILLATRRGRRFAATRVLKALRSAAVSLRRVAASPVKLALLVGGSAMVTLANIGGLAASVQAFGGGAAFVEIGAVYMAASAIAAASPTPGGLGAIESRTGRRPDRRRPELGGGGVGRPHLPAGDLLATGRTGMDLPELLAAGGLPVTGRTTWRTLPGAQR